MALTDFQRGICKLLACNRRETGESYVAGGTALNVLMRAARLSRDIDLFHDTIEAVAASWQADRGLLETHGYSVQVDREREGFVEALVSRDAGQVVIQWTRDSAFRFFPLVEHEELGLTMHPFDLATNKVLALVGRLEVRDWVDVLACHEAIQPLGYLAWAATGKDPGFSPTAILEQGARSARYSHVEVEALDFEGVAPDAAELSRRWRVILGEARDLVEILPAKEAGKCILGPDGRLFSGDAHALSEALSKGLLHFHQGRIRGAFPVILGKE